MRYLTLEIVTACEKGTMYVIGRWKLPPLVVAAAVLVSMPMSSSIVLGCNVVFWVCRVVGKDFKGGK